MFEHKIKQVLENILLRLGLIVGGLWCTIFGWDWGIALIVLGSLLFVKGFQNQYSLSLLILLIGLLTIGVVLLSYGYFFAGTIPMIFGGLMCKGFKQPSDAAPRKVWLLSLMGEMTGIKVNSLTLVLDWLPIKLIGYNEISMEKTDFDFKLTKIIKCGGDNSYISGVISVAMMPDEDDDRPGTLDWKSGALKLQDFLNAGGIEGCKKQLDEILTTWVENVANTPNNDADLQSVPSKKPTSAWMESHGLLITDILLPQVRGLAAGTRGANNVNTDDTRGLGLRFTKFQTVLQPDQSIVTARNAIQVGLENREANVNFSVTINRQIGARIKLYKKHNPGQPLPSIAEIRRQIFEEDLARTGQLTQVNNPGGVNLVQTGQPRPTP